MSDTNVRIIVDRGGWLSKSLSDGKKRNCSLFSSSIVVCYALLELGSSFKKKKDSRNDDIGLIIASSRDFGVEQG